MLAAVVAVVVLVALLEVEALALAALVVLEDRVVQHQTLILVAVVVALAPLVVLAVLAPPAESLLNTKHQLATYLFLKAPVSGLAQQV
jgi:hypothetical protein